MTEVNETPIIFCRCCEEASLFKILDSNYKVQAFNLCLNCFHIQRDGADFDKSRHNDSHLNAEWIHRYLYSKYGDNRIDLNLLEISSSQSKFEKLDDINIRSTCIDYASVTDDYIKSRVPADFIVAENLLDIVLQPKKILDRLSDILDPNSGVLVITLGTDIHNNISVFSAYSLSVLASRSGFGIIDVFTIRRPTSEIIVAFLKKYEAHSKSLDNLIHQEELDGQYNIGTYYEDR